jgi:DNA polymerase
MPPAHVVEEILAAVRDGALEWLEMGYGAPMHMISQCTRSFFVAPEGRKLIVGDFANVEGRGTAWISGEEWKLRAFRDADAGKGPGIYELTASKILGVPIENITEDSPERQIGKVAELAFGYQGGVGAARKFLPARMRDTKDKVLNEWKLAWRAQHPKTVATWKQLEQAAICAVQDASTTFEAGFPGRGVQFRKGGSFLWCKLPSGRLMCFPYPKLLAGPYGEQLTYMTVPSETTTDIIDDVKNANNWARVSTFGGKLMQNMMEAICRDLLVDAMLELDRLRHPIVLHVHDEIVIETLAAGAEKSREVMENVMRSTPAWATGFPVYAKCKIMQRYGK